jgi:hypothetical protein
MDGRERNAGARAWARWWRRWSRSRWWRRFTVYGAAVIAGALTQSCNDGAQRREDGSGAAPAAGDPTEGALGQSSSDPSGRTPSATGVARITIDAGTGAPVGNTARGLNYWMGVPTSGDPGAGTEALIEPLGIELLRIGGHDNDNNDPTPFTTTELDSAIGYAHAIGAEPLLQVPLLADTAGDTPTATTAANMVTYANITRGYGLKYFSIGNEPDLYPSQELGFESYSAQSFCQSVNEYSLAMRAVDPSIQLIGPDLSWKYQTPDNDWLTPILQGCGEHFDIISVHRYRLEPGDTTIARVKADAALFRSEIGALRAKLQSAGLADRPLAITETNVTWTTEGSALDASPGTLAAGLWLADAYGVAIEQGLWTLGYWSGVEGHPLGLLSEQRDKRATYHTLDLLAQHLGLAPGDPEGARALLATSDAPDIHAYATRGGNDDRTFVLIVNWTRDHQRLDFQIDGLPYALPDTSVTVPPFAASAIEIRDGAAPTGATYGEAEWNTGAGVRRFR